MATRRGLTGSRQHDSGAQLPSIVFVAGVPGRARDPARTACAKSIWVAVDGRRDRNLIAQPQSICPLQRVATFASYHSRRDPGAQANLGIIGCRGVVMSVVQRESAPTAIPDRPQIAGVALLVANLQLRCQPSGRIWRRVVVVRRRNSRPGRVVLRETRDLPATVPPTCRESPTAAGNWSHSPIRTLRSRRRPDTLRGDAEQRSEKRRQRRAAVLAVAVHIDPDAAAGADSGGQCQHGQEGRPAPEAPQTGLAPATGQRILRRRLRWSQPGWRCRRNRRTHERSRRPSLRHQPRSAPDDERPTGRRSRRRTRRTQPSPWPQ